MKTVPVIRPGRMTERKARIVEMSELEFLRKLEKSRANECGEAGEKDEEESDGEETAKKSFLWENPARSHLQRFGHP